MFPVPRSHGLSREYACRDRASGRSKELAVRFRLVPRDDGFYPLFDDAAENVAECARRLRDLLDHFADDITSVSTRDRETSRSSST